MQSETQTTDTALHALLIGINDWKFPDQIKSLRGCHNDVALIKSTLGSIFEPDSVVVTTMFDEQATVDGIVQAFRDHLIKPARAWFEANSNDAENSPAFLFHFSGHGTQVNAPDNTKASGLDESLCTWDMEKGKVFGLRDWRLGELVDELTEYTDNATIILDCCHSGTGMRDAGDVLVARQAEPDLSPPPADLQRKPRKRTNAHDDGFRLAVSNRSVLLAACKSTQKAFEFEKKIPSAAKSAGKDASSAKDVGKSSQSPPKQIVNGAFTFSLSQALARMPPGKVPTYDELYRTTCRFVSYKSRSQRPQLEGGRERVLFGTKIKPRELWMSVRSKKDNRIEVDGGLCHGISEGAELTVYEKTARAADPDQKIAHLRVVDSDAVRCFCEPVNSDAKIPLDAPVGIAKLAAIDNVHSVRVSSDLKQRLDALDDRSMKSVIQLVHDGPADFTLLKGDAGFELRDGEGSLLETLPENTEDTSVVKLLNRWARYFAALDIKNEAVGPELAGKIDLRLLRAPSKHETQPIETPADGLVRIDHGSIVRIEVTNNAKTPLYITLLSFTASGEVQMMYPTDAGRREQFSPHEPFQTGRYRLMINGDHLSDSIDTLKVIATKEESDFSLLCVKREQKEDQGKGSHRSLSTNKIPAGLSGLMKQASLFSHHRDAVALDDDEDDDTWVTAELTYQLVRPIEATTFNLQGSDAQSLGSTGLAIQSDSCFQGKVAVMSSAQMAHRSIAEPQWLGRASGVGLDPLSLASGQPQPECELWAMQIQPDSSVATDSLSQISPEEPLRIQLPSIANGTLVAIADHENSPLLVGVAEAGSRQLDITALPDRPSVLLYLFQQTRSGNGSSFQVGEVLA